MLQDFSLTVQNGDKIAFVGPDHLAKTTLFQIIAGELKPDSGSYEWGLTITPAYYPKDNSSYFTDRVNLVQWLQQYTTSDDESYLRGFLGRMLFSGDEALKMVNVLSGGEKVRCMLAKMMLSGANTLIFDEPTNHLDLESIQALNTGLTEFTTVANRIIEFCPEGKIIDKRMSFDEYLMSDDVKALRDSLYHEHQRLSI